MSELVSPSPEESGSQPLTELVFHRYVDKKPERTGIVWDELRLHPPHLVAVLSDSVQYVVDDNDQIVGFEPSDTGRDRIDAAIAISREFPESSALTLSNSFDNITEYFPDAILYQMSMILAGHVKPGRFLMPDSRTYDTFTELISIAHSVLPPTQGTFDNIVIVTNSKQLERVRVMLNTILFANEPDERGRLDHYFTAYMPARLRIVGDPRMHEAVTDYERIAYQDIVTNTALLQQKHFTIISSEDITGSDLGTDEERKQNLRGMQDWLEGSYGQVYMQQDASIGSEGVIIRTRTTAEQTEIPRIHIPRAGSPGAERKGIVWGLSADLL